MAIKMEKIKAGVKEGFRKFLVTFKRNPQYIPLIMLLISFLEYSLNLTAISDTTAKIYGDHMGLCAFVSMLFSILSFVCMLNAYPKRQKPNILMMLLMVLMYGAVIFADYTYYTRIVTAIEREINPIEITADTMYISDAKVVVSVHMILIAITILCVILEPLFAVLLKKINTSIEVEDNGKIESLDLSED